MCLSRPKSVIIVQISWLVRQGLGLNFSTEIKYKSKCPYRLFWPTWCYYTQTKPNFNKTHMSCLSVLEIFHIMKSNNFIDILVSWLFKDFVLVALGRSWQRSRRDEGSGARPPAIQRSGDHPHATEQHIWHAEFSYHQRCK